MGDIVDDIRDNTGIHLRLVVNLRSVSRSDFGVQATYQFGVNQLPTQAEVEKAVNETIEKVKGQTKVEDLRLTTFEDFGLAEPANMTWPPQERA